MEYSIVYSSNTGNTLQLAQTIKDYLPQNSISYFGKPDSSISLSEVLFVGFWCDKGTCDDAMSLFLKSLNNKKIFLFGTCGFGKDEDYFKKIISNVSSLVNDSNEIIDSFMCQGKMQIGIRHKYESMLDQNPTQMSALIDNFDKALSHPDETDLNNLLKHIKSYTESV